MMRCSKCGETCNDNQAFCLKCGNPIQVVPDFNLIEAELANNIGKLLDEAEVSGSDRGSDVSNSDFDDMRTKKISGSALDMELQMVDISRNKSNRVFVSNNRVEGDDTKITENIEDDFADEVKEDNGNKKKRIIIMSSIIAIVLISIIAVSVIVINKLSDKNNYNKATFDSSYANAETHFENGEYDDAIKQINIALDKASNADEKIKARVYLEQIYLKLTGRDEERINNLMELTKLCPSEPSYFKLLAEYYTQNKQYDSLSKFLTSIENDDVFEALSLYTTKAPTADKEDGSYSDYFNVTLTSPQENTKMYYVIHRVTSLDDKTEFKAPTVEDTLYEGSIAFNEEGTYVVLAVAISDLGISSRPLIMKYAVSLSAPAAPVITPASGKYTEHTKISIEVPEGAVVYYAFDNEPLSEESNKYTEPFDMLVGAHVVKAYLTDKHGLKSETTEESYTLNLTRNYNTAQAKKAIIDRLISTGVILNDKGDMADNRSLAVNYDSTGIILNSEYHIYSLIYKSAEGADEKMEYMGVDCNTGMIVTMVSTDAGYTLDEKSLAELEALKSH